jgi:hypothetical protein
MKSVPPRGRSCEKKIDPFRKRTCAPADDTTTMGNFPFARLATYCERGAQVRFLNGSIFFHGFGSGWVAVPMTRAVLEGRRPTRHREMDWLHRLRTVPDLATH